MARRYVSDVPFFYRNVFIMKSFLSIAATLTLALVAGVAQADRLDDIKKTGVLKVASFDSNPPFGFVDQKSRQITGLDVDFAQALADKQIGRATCRERG